MKLLIVLGIIFLLAWLFRGGRKKNAPKGNPAQPQVQPPSNMVRCPVCQLHLPQADAVIGARGPYCSLAHRDAAELPPPAS